MSKRLKTAAELVALLNAELRKQDACTGVSVDGVSPVADEKVAYTWTATVVRRSGGPVPGQCSRFFVATVAAEVSSGAGSDALGAAAEDTQPEPMACGRHVRIAMRDVFWSRTTRLTSRAKKTRLITARERLERAICFGLAELRFLRGVKA
jgi:hypothetical protein